MAGGADFVSGRFGEVQEWGADAPYAEWEGGGLDGWILEAVGTIVLVVNSTTVAAQLSFFLFILYFSGHLCMFLVLNT